MMPNKLLLPNEHNYFLDQCSNPVAWYHQHSVQEEMAFKVGLDNVMNMKHAMLAEQYTQKKLEYVWDLFLCNTRIIFYYVMQDNLNKALEIINETKKMLSRLSEHSTNFLDSIKPALYHITLTTKGYILTKSHLNNSKSLQDSFVALQDMDATNTAALHAVKSVFSGLYTNRWCILSKVCLVHSVTLNPMEPEWHYMLSRCLTDYRKRLRFMAEVLPQELAEAEMAVRLSDRPHYKCHLANLLHHVPYKGNYTPNTIRAIELIRDIMGCSDDPFILRNCLKILTKMSCNTQLPDVNIVSLVETIISKIMNSSNCYVRDSIGYYYMHFEKDLEKAKVYLKMASDNKCFYASIDYMHLSFKLDPINTDIVKILDDYLNVYSFLSSRHKLLCLVISYQLLNKKNIIGAFKYIDELLDIKVVTFIRRMQNYSTTFYNRAQKFNLLTVIFDQLKNNLKNKIFSPENLDVVKRLFKKINEFNLYVHSLGVKTEYGYKDLNTKIQFLNQNEMVVEGKCCTMSYSSIHNVNIKTSTENWRTLKPNDSPNIFMLNKRQDYGNSRRPTRLNE